MPDNWDFSPGGGTQRPASKTTPLITYALIALCIVITIGHLTTDRQSGGFLYQLGNFGLTTPNEVWDGKIYGLFTSFFVHLSWMHLIFNMMWLNKLGTVLEESLHPFVYVLFLLAAAGVGSCSELMLTGQSGAGASGVVYAIFGLMWAGRGAFPAWRALATRDNLNLFLVWGVFCIFTTLFGWFAVANGAHFGGLLFGLAIGYLFFAPRRQPVWGLALAGLGIVCTLALTWLPWSSGWNWHKGGKAFDRKDYHSAITYFEHALKWERNPRNQKLLHFNLKLCWAHLAVAADEKHDLAASKEAIARMKAEEAKDGSEDDDKIPESDTDAPQADLLSPESFAKPKPTNPSSASGKGGKK